MEWIQEAICRQVDPDLFVADGHAHQVWHKSQKAIKICNTCPVKRECQDFALSWARQAPIFGVWGGLTANQINKMARHPSAKRAA